VNIGSKWQQYEPKCSCSVRQQKEKQLQLQNKDEKTFTRCWGLFFEGAQNKYSSLARAGLWLSTVYVFASTSTAQFGNLEFYLNVVA